MPGFATTNIPTFQLLLDSQLIGSYSATTCSYVDTSFTVTPTTSGTHTLTFHTLQGATIDTSTFLDDLRLTAQLPQSITVATNPASTSWNNTSTISPSGTSGTGATSYALDDGTNGNTSSSVCSLNGSTVSATGPGTCYVNATIASGGGYSAAASTDAAVVFTQADQTISFTAPTSGQNGDSDNLAASASSGLPVSFTVDPSSNACALSGSTVNLLGSGTCVIDANQGGNTSYNAAPQQQQSISVSLTGATEIHGFPSRNDTAHLAVFERGAPCICPVQDIETVGRSYR